MGVDFDHTSGAPVRPIKLAHVVLRTANKPAMAAFYKDFLGGHASHENELLSFITYDDEHHRIAIAQLPFLKPKDKTTCGLEVSRAEHSRRHAT
jgi:catechol-2,3-dioxygenase